MLLDFFTQSSHLSSSSRLPSLSKHSETLDVNPLSRYHASLHCPDFNPGSRCRRCRRSTSRTLSMHKQEHEDEKGMVRENLWAQQHLLCLLISWDRRTLANSDKLSYINAVKCLMGKPPQLASVFPGSKSRYDDFVALHINSTN